jgi:hypothetical protein
MTQETEQQPELFVNRSLGKGIVEALRDVGLVVHSMADVYGEKRAQRLADEVWLRDAGENDWIVLTKDDAIRRRPAERDALTEAEVRALPDERAAAWSRADRAIRQQQAPDPSPSQKGGPLHLPSSINDRRTTRPVS